jgi:hypothetical protein
MKSQTQIDHVFFTEETEVVEFRKIHATWKNQISQTIALFSTIQSKNNELRGINGTVEFF